MLIKSDPQIISSYLEDSSNLKGGHADEVVIPADIEELSGFVKDAFAKKIPITVSGGGTGTTGSRIPFGGAVISTEKLNKILDISESGMCAAIQTGVLVEDLKSACDNIGLFYTSHPTQMSAFVGGTVATNASGSRSLKYGPTRKRVNMLKMILPTGELFCIRRGEKFIDRQNSRIAIPDGRVIDIPIPAYRMPDVKSSAGYYAKPGMDLIDLFIGQEGTLSIIVEIEIGLVKKPAGIFSCFVFFDREPDAWLFAKDAKKIKDILSVEYFDSNALELLRDKNPNVPGARKAAIFFELIISGADDAGLEELIKLIEKHGSSMDNTWAAMNEKDAGLFTTLRYAIPESVNEIIRRSGFKKLSADIAVPDDKFMEMMNFYMNAFKKESLKHVIFGHIGESHVHVNILPKSSDEEKRALGLSLDFVRKGLSLGGTVSAEHGIGKIKHRYLEEMYGKEGILEMAGIKKAFDPNCILGLDNIFPKEYLNMV
ncbi:MAG: FAD-binding oxidoreductase [Candidatus Omnitrophota bacterium]|nr:FAD-binding oxidoreductase [Candidatus Omnitrophota bacterium]